MSYVGTPESHSAFVRELVEVTFTQLTQKLSQRTLDNYYYGKFIKLVHRFTWRGYKILLRGHVNPLYDFLEKDGLYLEVYLRPDVVNYDHYDYDDYLYGFLAKEIGRLCELRLAKWYQLELSKWLSSATTSDEFQLEFFRPFYYRYLGRSQTRSVHFIALFLEGKVMSIKAFQADGTECDVYEYFDEVKEYLSTFRLSGELNEVNRVLSNYHLRDVLGDEVIGCLNFVFGLAAAQVAELFINDERLSLLRDVGFNLELVQTDMLTCEVHYLIINPDTPSTRVPAVTYTTLHPLGYMPKVLRHQVVQDVLSRKEKLREVLVTNLLYVMGVREGAR